MEFQAPELHEGDTAEVIILPVEHKANGHPAEPLIALFGKAAGGFASAAEADAFIRGLRDEWEDRP